MRRNFGTADNKAVEAIPLQDDIRKGINPDAKQDASQEKNVVEGDKLIDTHGAYLDSPRNVAKESNVPFIDMNKTQARFGRKLRTERIEETLYVGARQQLLPCLKVVKTILTSIYTVHVS